MPSAEMATALVSIPATVIGVPAVLVAVEMGVTVLGL